MILMLIMSVGCVNSPMTAHRQFKEAELFADNYAKDLRAAGFIWSGLEYSDE